MLTTVCFDVGETLVDETAQWAAWAQWLEVPLFSFAGAMGGLIARGRDHREVVALLRPGRTFDQERAARLAADGPWPSPELYADVLPCLAALRADGWQLVVGGNQPLTYQRTLAGLALPVDVLTSSGELEADKPDPAFYARLAARAGVRPEHCVHVGDRVDNDVVGAAGAGMLPVHLRRGPWGLLHDAPPGVAVVHSLAALPALLRTLR